MAACPPCRSPSSRRVSDGGRPSPSWWGAARGSRLLDEPHAGLDHEARQLLDETILEARQGGATVILSSHELGEMAEPGRQRLSDRTVRLAGGRVEGRPTITGAGPIAHRQQPAAATPPGAVHVA